MNNKENFWLEEYLADIPAVKIIESGIFEDGLWWIKINIDTTHSLAWNVVQELWHILNYLSIHERLPTLFMPVSPPPYMNWWPKDYLNWIIQSKDLTFTPNKCKEWLEWRLPRPVKDINQWTSID